MNPNRVLVVDDDPDMRASVARVLAAAGYAVEVAEDGQQAIDVQRARPAQILITDVFMPARDGLETIQFFRASLLYDSLIVRLHKDIDPVQEWKDYTKIVGKDAQERFTTQVQKRLAGGPARSDYLQAERAADTANQFFFRFQREVAEQAVAFRNTLG